MKHHIICCVAGKSGGHIVPCLEFAKTHYAKNPRILFISTKSSLDTKIITQLPDVFDHQAINLEPVPYKKWWKFPLFFISCIKACLRSFWYLKKKKPERIVSTGGFIAIPVCFAAQLLGIPFDLIELNIIPGKATTFISRFSKQLFICFSETAHFFKKSCTHIKYPIRFTKNDLRISNKKKLFTSLKLDPSKKTIFILGGSQGSEFLNHMIQELPRSLLKTWNIIHQTGIAHISQCKKFYTEHDITAIVFDYQNNLAPYYHAADLVLCRAGAGTLFETLFFKKECIVIPLETTITDHQLDNALAFAKKYPMFVKVIRQQDIMTNANLFLKAFSAFN